MSFTGLIFNQMNIRSTSNKILTNAGFSLMIMEYTTLDEGRFYIT